MKSAFTILTALIVAPLVSLHAADTPQATLDAKHRAFFKDNCLSCHNAEKQKGKVRLDDIAFSVDSVEKADLWQKVLNSINSGEMPPEDEKQPDPAAKTDFLDDLSRMLVTARAVLSDSGGKIAMRRLNRREYKNTIRDLLGVDINVRELPADGGAGTFDTVGSSLFMSSDQFEQYLTLGRQALDEHFARMLPVTALTGGQTFKSRIETELLANKEMAGHLSRLKKDYDRYKQWTAAVDAEAAKPGNTVLVKEVREHPQVKSNPDNFYIQWAKNRDKPSPKQFGFPEADLALFFGKTQFDRGNRYFSEYLAMPLKDSGSYLLTYQGHEFEKVTVDAKWPAGTYTLRVRLAALDDAPEQRRFIQFGQHGENIAIFTIMGTYQVTGTMAQPQILEIPVNVTSAGKREFVIREKHAIDRAAMSALWWESFNKTGTGPKPALWIDWMELEGPAGAATAIANTASPKPQKLRKDPEQWANKYMPIYAEGYVEKYSRFQKWCAAIDEAAKKPEHAEAVAKLRADPRFKTQPHLFYSGFAKLKDSPQPSQFGFRDVDDAQFARSEYTYHHQYYADYAKLPARDTGTWLMLYSLGRYTGITASEKWPAGKYTLRIRLAASDGSPKERRFIEIGTGKADAADFNVLSSHQVTGTLANPQMLEIPVEINASGDRNFAIRDKRPNTREAEYAMFREAWDKTGTGPRPCIWVDFVELEGPLNAMAAQPVAQSFKKHLEPELESNKRVADQHQRLEKRFDDFKRWAAAMDAFAQKPEHQQAVAKLPQGFNGWRRGIAYYQGVAALPGAPSAKDFGFLDMSSALFDGADTFRNDHPYLGDYLKLPHKDTGSYLTMFKVNPKEVIRAEASWPAGRYTLRIKAAAVEDSPPERRFIEVGHPDPGTRSGPADDPMVISVLKAVQVTGTLASPQVIEIPVEISLTGSREFVLREKRPNNGEASVEIWREHLAKNKTGPKPTIWIDWIELVSADATPPTPALTNTIKEHREVELHANAMVGGTYNGYFKGGYEAAKKFMETKQPQKGIPDEQEAKFRIRGFEQNGPTFERYLNDPLTKTGSYLTIYNVHTEEVITLPPDQPSGWLKTKHEVEKAEPGEYKLRFRIGAVKGTPKERHFVALGSRMKPEEREDFTLMQTFQISGTTDGPQVIEVPVSITANGPRTFVLREKRDVKLDHELFTTAQKETGVGPPSALWIDWVEWEGPLAPQTTIAKVEHIEPEKRRAEVERGHLRFKYLNEQYAKWKAAGGDEKRLQEFDFTDKSHAEFAKVVWDSNNRWFQQYLDRPLSKTGLFLDNTVQETCEYAIDMPADLASGDYVMRVKISRVPDMPSERAFLTFVEASPIDKDDRTFLANKQITAMLDQPEIIELPFKIVPGGPRKFVLFEKRPMKKEAISLPGRTRLIADAKQRDPVLWIDWIEYEGPLAPANAKSSVPPVITAGESNARQVLETFAKRAFRGKTPSAAFLDKLAALHETRLKAGESFDKAIREPLSVILASPGFLYLQESGLSFSSSEKAELGLKPKPLSQSELASRLSYFLWSAPPDEPLLKADLTKPEIIAREVDRMIASPKADEFVSGFVHQWLGMDRLDFFQFDTKQFRDFDESAKAAARREVYETFAHLLRHNGSLTGLLKSDQIHVNGLLATYYGIEGISGDAFQKVKLPAGSPRGGLLGMAAILAMGSNGERTSPVERGAWVLRKLLHNPPPPAPPNVPQLTRLENKLLNTRERLLAHQEEPQCLQCHRKIDFIGFGLENFNAAGKWRTEETFEKRGVGKKTWPIDPSGQFYNGPAFQDYFQLRDLIAAKSEDFARGFTEALIEYALGRPYGFTDAALADDIVKHAKAKGFAMKEFFVALAMSGEFKTK
jgi:hypothetical protein